MAFGMIFLLCVTFGVTLADVLQCPESWYLEKEFCYSYGEATVTWADALEVCRSYGGKLAEIETEEENNFLKNLIKSKKAHQAWIGGTDILSEGHWEWISTGLSINYTDWGVHQPDDAASGEDCLMYAQDLSYQWNDFPCSYSANFVCETESVSHIG